MNFAVLASGYGGNLQAIIHAVKNKKIKANLKLVVSDRADAYALVRAKKAKISNIFINPKDFSNREAFDRKVLAYLKDFDIDFVVLAGYMRLLSVHFVQQYPNKILNIHPSLLPAFKGVHAIREAFEYGVKVTGVSVHFVDEQMDAGAIITQQAVNIDPKDTLNSLAKKIHSVEHKIYPQAIGWLARRKLKVVGRKVPLR